jgi:3-hydroxybutyryl-CoA dehydrogenase
MTSIGDLTEKDFKQIGVVGAGQMGSGIAQTMSLTRKVLLYDVAESALNKARQSIEESFNRLVKKNIFTLEAAREALSRITVTTSLQDFKDVDCAVEAATEHLETKKNIFNTLSCIVKETAILASNTSSFSITTLAAAATRPERVIGMHFMNPVPVMKLVEIIRGLQTSDKVYTSIRDLCLAIDKIPVLGIDAPGFIVNRVLVPMINEAIFLLEQGVRAEDIDTAMKFGTNQPMGPLQLADFVGLDTLLSILQYMHKELGEDKYRPCPLLKKYVDAGWFGKKSGRGFYLYAP